MGDGRWLCFCFCFCFCKFPVYCISNLSEFTELFPFLFRAFSFPFLFFSFLFIFFSFHFQFIFILFAVNSLI